MSCELSPAASAFSAVLSAFVGSIINGFASGWLVAFMTGWIAWMAVFRVLLSGLYMLFRSVTNSWGPGKTKESYDSVQNDPEAESIAMNTSNTNNNLYDDGYGNPGSNLNSAYSNYYQPSNNTGLAAFTDMKEGKRRYMSTGDTFKAMWPSAGVVRGLEQAPTNKKLGTTANHPVVRTWWDLNFDVTALGWFSWVYTAVFAPVSQAIWIAANVSLPDRGASKIVKGLTTAVTALPLCIDCKVRYGEKLGPVGKVVFNVMTSISVLVQGSFCAFLLVSGALDVTRNSRIPMPVVFVYPVFSLVWMFGSYGIMPMRDGGRKSAGQAHWAGYILDVGMGAFAGIFLAAPAMMLYLSVIGGPWGSKDGAGELAAYLSCETAVFRKWAAVMP